MTKKTIVTNQQAVTCDVCGRTLLRGERADVFLTSGSRRTVCELCTPRAAHEGWIREGIGDESLKVRSRRGRDRGSSLFGRLRGQRRETDNPSRRHAPRAAADEPLEAPILPYADEHEPVYVADVAPAPAPRVHSTDPSLLAPEPRNVHAVPTNADMKRARAVDVFNASDHTRTVAGVARSLGLPYVVVRPSETEGSIVSIVCGWELCWYRYEVDLADEASGVRVTAQGAELSELESADHEPNAAATADGQVQMVGAG